jgi:hypothetical protein
MLDVPEAELAAILSRGQIPMLRFMQQGDSGRVSLEIKDIIKVTIIAITHV